MRSKQSEKGLLFFSPEKGDELRYFTNSPFERLMMEKPCGQSKAADAAWREYEDDETEMCQGADARASAFLRFNRKEGKMIA